MCGVIVVGRVLFLAGEGGKEDAAEEDDAEQGNDEKRGRDVHGKEEPPLFSLAWAEAAGGVRSGTNFDGGSERDAVPDFVDFVVGDGDAAEGPVVEAMGRADGAHAVGQAVNHDVSAG